MFGRVRLKLTLLLVAVFFVLYGISAAAVYAWMARITLGEVDAILGSEASPVAHHIATSLFMGQDISPFHSPPPISALFVGQTLLILRDPTGRVIATTDQAAGNQIPFSVSLANANATFFTVSIHRPSASLRVVTMPLISPFGQLLGYLQLARNIAPELTVLRRLERILLFVGGSGLLLAGVAAFYASNRALLPIKRSWRRQQQFVADASHELRTPLAVIQTNLDIVLGHAQEGVADNLEWLNHAKSEARRLSRLTEDLLTLARADANVRVLQLEPVRLDAICQDVIDSLGIFAQAKDIVLLYPDVTHTDDWLVSGDGARLHQLVYILLDNAIKYTESGGEVRVEWTKMRQQVRLQVSDTGIGMDKSEVSQVFERFYRGDEARNRASGGTGLGLAIAKWIVDGHKGRISVHSEVGKGTTFSVFLPGVK